MGRKNGVTIFKIILAILVLLICIGLIIYLFPVMKNLSTTEGQIAFKEKIDESGILGLLILFGLQLAQIFLIIIPRRTIRNTSWNVLWRSMGNNICNGICMYYINNYIFIG